MIARSFGIRLINKTSDNLTQNDFGLSRSPSSLRRNSVVVLQWTRAVGIALVLASCDVDAPPRAGSSEQGGDADSLTSPAIQLVDPAIPPAVAGEDGWNYRQSAEADLDGDGQPERAVLTARVEMVRGRPAWDDGQPWQVYVEEQDGRRTYIYAQRLQIGTLTMRLGRGSAGQSPPIVLLVHLPDQLSLYEVTYMEPDRSSVAMRFQRDLDPRGDIASPPLP